MSRMFPDVIAAQAGSLRRQSWIPACAGKPGAGKPPSFILAAY